MRKDKQERLNRFADLIAETIKAGDPLYVQMFEGFVWVALAQPAWCEKLGISDHTLRDLAKCPPIVSTKTVNDEGKPLVLYRLGEKSHESARHLANKMAKAYREKYGIKRLRPSDWGCLVGLAGVWPDGVELEIFRSVLKDVGAFMAGVRWADPDCPHSIRFYQWVPIPLIRKYPHVALEMYIIGIQAAGQTPPPSIAALHPNIWPKHQLVFGKKAGAAH
jgi:hypothetical protein